MTCVPGNGYNTVLHITCGRDDRNTHKHKHTYPCQYRYVFWHAHIVQTQTTTCQGNMKTTLQQHFSTQRDVNVLHKKAHITQRDLDAHIHTLPCTLVILCWKHHITMLHANWSQHNSQWMVPNKQRHWRSETVKWQHRHFKTSWDTHHN